MIHVIATVQVADGKRDELLGYVQELLPLVRAEDGCVEYGPAIDVPTNIAAQGNVRANVVTIIEKWQDLSALEHHLVAPHMVAYREKVKSLIQKVSLQILEPA